MKSKIKFILFIMLGLGFWRCSEDEEIINEPKPNTPNTIVNFAFENQTL